MKSFLKPSLMYIIFVIKNGKLIDSGKHDELINSCDYYKSLYEKQLK